MTSFYSGTTGHVSEKSLICEKYSVVMSLPLLLILLSHILDCFQKEKKKDREGGRKDLLS